MFTVCISELFATNNLPAQDESGNEKDNADDDSAKEEKKASSRGRRRKETPSVIRETPEPAPVILNGGKHVWIHFIENRKTMNMFCLKKYIGFPISTLTPSASRCRKIIDQ